MILLKKERKKETKKKKKKKQGVKRKQHLSKTLNSNTDLLNDSTFLKCIERRGKTEYV